jgi:hypothetical protein
MKALYEALDRTRGKAEPELGAWKEMIVWRIGSRDKKLTGKNAGSFKGTMAHGVRSKDKGPYQGKEIGDKLCAYTVRYREPFGEYQMSRMGNRTSTGYLVGRDKSKPPWGWWYSFPADGEGKTWTAKFYGSIDIDKLAYAVASLSPALKAKALPHIARAQKGAPRGYLGWWYMSELSWDVMYKAARKAFQLNFPLE